MRKYILPTFLLTLMLSFNMTAQCLEDNNEQLPAELIESIEDFPFCSDLSTIPSGGLCDCPAGSLVVGYEGWAGAFWGDDVLSEFSLICRALNSDGTLGDVTTVTCSNGDEQTVTAIPAIEATPGSAMVGAQTNIGCGLDGIVGYELPVADIIAMNPNNGATPMPIIGGTGGTANPVQFVPDGQVIIGMEVFTDSTKNDIAAGVSWHYAEIVGCITSISENITDEIIIHPNPFDSYIMINGLEGENEVKLFDVKGKEIMNVVTNENKLDLAHLEAGVYILNIRLKDNLLVRKIVKR